ncbi:lysophospholipid acyltransferase family protein [Pedobacter frigoris]|uniref:1-acyl-sn-glycerol-3-phosphate acyltransferase n=1 Tax=Pedobacter frigoris TaxID=2571272 RepID=A0A4U1CGZ8_9SPHI|nr:lysophospholipid acyltransferase family protein [Pedobacter frigoris]TKC06024.1 1-acyl-sn-glycerol-3-phosphate acyltransferase [Pedobacter frigoris]
MITLLRHVHRLYSVLIILVFSILFYPFYYYASRKPERYLLLNRFRKLNSHICSFLIGVYYRFDFEVPLEKGKTYIYCANHTSNLDIMILCILAKGRFHFMGKQELLENPVLKIFFKTIDVPVNRDSKISAFRAFKKVGDNLEQGMSLIIFPEGKIDNHYPPKLVHFKNGPFRLAIEKNIAIVPVSMTDVWKKMWDDGVKYGTRPGLCHIYVHKPISTKELNIDDSDLLKDRIFELINNKLVHR